MNLIPRSNFWNEAMDLMGDSFFQDKPVMRSDLYLKDGNYVLEMDLPGVKKEDINMELHNGYLTVSAKKEEQQEEKGEYIRKERFYGEITRSFYVGEIGEEKIQASFENGTLKVTFPKEGEKETRKQIAID